MERDIDYTLSFNAIGQKDTDGRALLMIYVSGSSMLQSTELYTDEDTEQKIAACLSMEGEWEF